ncbi:MAG: N-acetylmuramic acid 6-phosphate etherase [Candidatus Bathyarchaeota archaeon]
MSRVTEKRNIASKGIDERPIREILEIINKEDQKISQAIHSQLSQIEAAVEGIVKAIKAGGSVYLVGAGSSGRLCVLEASEIPPTFGLPPEKISAVIAGGVKAIYTSVEAAEDDSLNGVQEMEKLGLKEKDIVIGVAASGSTPFVLGSIVKARQLGVTTVGLSCNNGTPLSQLVDTAIEVVVGPEVVAGSTRMKAGTAQKMVLNMMTTTAMIRLGYVYDGYMVGVQSTNIKLRERSKGIVADITGAHVKEAERALEAAEWDVRVAILLTMTDMSPEKAARELGPRTLRQLLETRGENDDQ